MMSSISIFSKLTFYATLTCLFITRGIAQVTLQTGAPEIGIPIYSYADIKSGLSTSVSLTYAGGNGIKVNDIANSVGTGWDIAYGGVIQRIQNGEPDDQKFVDLHTSMSLPDRTDKPVYDGLEANVFINQYYPNGYLYTTVSPTTSVTDKVAFHPMFPDHIVPFRYKPNSEDREQDVFVFQFGGRSGRFVIGKDKSILQIEDSRIKISFDEIDMTGQGIRTRISKFSITDENGIEYIFDEKEINESLIPGHNTEINANSFNVMTGTYLQPTKVVSKWFLREIKNPRTNKKISFHYTSHAVDFFGAKTATRQILPDATVQTTETINRTKATVKKISHIVTPDNQRVQFNYSLVGRVDLEHDYPLESISISQNEIFKYRYKLKYGYFFKKQIKEISYSFLAAEKRYARLCLKSIVKVDKNGTELSPHLFEYYLLNSDYSENDVYWQRGIPARFTYCSDFLGFYSGEFGMEDANGKWLNITANQPNHGFARLGLIKKVVYPEGGQLEFEYSNNRAQNSPYYATSHGGLSGGVSVSKTILHDGISHANDIVREYKYIMENGNSSFWGFEPPISDHIKDVRVWKGVGQRQGILTRESVILYKADFGKAIGQLGLSTLSIMENRSINLYSILIMLFLSILIEEFTPDFKDYSYNIWSNVNMVQRNPLPAQYERVEVWENNNGSTIYEFTSPSFHPLIEPTYGFPFSAKPRAAHWVYGLPKTISWKNQNGDLIRKEENIYSPVVNVSSSPNFLSVKWEVTKSNYEKYSKMPTANTSEYVTSEQYYPVSGHVKLLETNVTTSNSSGQSVVETIKYTYTDDLQVKTVEKMNSLGGSDGTTYHYPQDYSLPTEPEYITNMKEANMYNLPVAIAYWIRESAFAGSKKTTKTIVSRYFTIANGDSKLEKTFIKEEFEPQIGSYSDTPPTLNPLMPGFSNVSTYIYDNNGNSVQQTTHEKPTSGIYDYNGSILIAEATNSTYDQIAYTSFEADGKGNWTFAGAATENLNAITGKKTYNLSAGAITKSVSNTNTYLVSYWRPSNLSALSITGTQSGYPKVNSETLGWKNYEHKITGVGTVTLAGSGMIDEVRLHPYNAAMNSYTYEPLIGISSKSDVNGRLLFNEYDYFGRLILVRDHDKNILKKICYSYAGQEETCQTFGNQVQSKHTQRNNCTGCFVGSYVTYTVPADTYFAGSQTAANALAHNDIHTNAQTYINANGTCSAPPSAVVNVTNNTFEYVSITLTNTCTGGVSNYSVYGSTSLGPIPDGIYNISIQSSEPDTYIVNGYSQSGVSMAYFYGIQISGSASIIIND